MKSFTPVNEKEFETAGFFIFGALSLIMAILKLVIWNSPLAKPSRKGDKFFDHKRWPRNAPCASPRASVAGNPGAVVQLEVRYQAGRRHLPIVILNRAA